VEAFGKAKPFRRSGGRAALPLVTKGDARGRAANIADAVREYLGAEAEQT